MRWQDYRRSDNVEEGSSSGPSMFGGGLRLSGGAIILVVVVSLLLGKNPLEMLALLTGDGGGPVVQTQAPPSRLQRLPLSLRALCSHLRRRS